MWLAAAAQAVRLPYVLPKEHQPAAVLTRVARLSVVRKPRQHVPGLYAANLQTIAQADSSILRPEAAVRGHLIPVSRQPAAARVILLHPAAALVAAVHTARLQAAVAAVPVE